MSGALSAFLRGAAGPGLIDWTNNQRRQDELEAQRAQRDKEIAAQAAERKQAREDQIEFRKQDREAQIEGRKYEVRMRYGYDPETGEPTGGGALNRARGAGAGGTGGGDETNIIGEVMARTGMSEADVRQRMAQGQAGFTRKAQQVEHFDDGDGRMRNVTKEVEEPDVKAYMEFSRTLGAAMMRSGGNPQQRATARQTDFETESGRAAQEPGLPQQRVGELATGVAVAGGKPLYDNGDSKYTPATGALTQAKTAKFSVEASKIKTEAGDIKTQTPEKLATTLNAITGLIRTYPENSMEPSDLAARKELQATAREIAAELKKRGLPGAAPAAAPAPAAPKTTLSALPPGAKQIGTSKGKPVYQTPDGRKFIGG